MRKAQPNDSRAVARLHRETIPWALLTQLGEDVVTAFYRAITQSPVAFCLVAEKNGAIDGFIAGVTDWRQLFKEVRWKAWWPALKAIPVLIGSGRWRQLIETSRYTTSKREGVDAEFLSMGVREDAEGRVWAGASLMYAAMNEFRRRGVPRVRGVAWERNDRAVQLFKAVGLRIVSEVEIHPGDRSVMFVLDLLPKEKEGGRDGVLSAGV